MTTSRISALVSMARSRTLSNQIALGCLALAAPLAMGCGSMNVSKVTTDDGGAVVTGDSGGVATGDAGTGADGGPPAPAVVHQLAGVDVATFAGSGVAGNKDGNGAVAEFSNPTCITLDAQGNLRVTEYDGSRIRSITPSGDVTTVTSQANFVRPYAMAIAMDGTFVVQTDNDINGEKSDASGTLWKVMPDGAAMPLVQGLGRPRGLGALPNDMIAVVDKFAHTVSVLNPTNGQMTLLAGATGKAGFVDGAGSVARFDSPYGAAILADGSIVVSDEVNNRLRTIAPDGTVTTLAGDGTPGMVDGPRLSAKLSAPRGIAADAAGNVYFSDRANQRIRRVNLAGEVETVAGNGVAGFHDGTGEAAQFYGQEGIAVTPDGKTLYVADGTSGDGNIPYHRVRKIALP